MFTYNLYLSVMKLRGNKDNLEDAIKGTDMSARKKAFRHHLPYAVLRDDVVILVYPDNHIEAATPERLAQLRLSVV